MTNETQSINVDSNIKLGDYVVLYANDDSRFDLFESCVYKVSATVGYGEHLTSVGLCPVKPESLTYFKSSIIGEEREVPLTEIACYHQRKIQCEELLVDHERYVEMRKSNRRHERKVKLHLYGKCKAKRDSF